MLFYQEILAYIEGVGSLSPYDKSNSSLYCCWYLQVLYCIDGFEILWNNYLGWQKTVQAGVIFT